MRKKLLISVKNIRLILQWCNTFVRWLSPALYYNGELYSVKVFSSDLLWRIVLRSSTTIGKYHLTLKEEQHTAIRAAYEGKDVFVCLHTGFGISRSSLSCSITSYHAMKLDEFLEVGDHPGPCMSCCRVFLWQTIIYWGSWTWKWGWNTILQDHFRHAWCTSSCHCWYWFLLSLQFWILACQF